MALLHSTRYTPHRSATMTQSDKIARARQSAAAYSQRIRLFALLSFRREPEVHLPDYMPSEDHWPSLDIFLPRYKEPWELYRQTLSAALSVTYPASKLHVYVLDDGRDNPVKHETKQHFYNTDKIIVQLSDGANDLFTSLSMMGYNGCNAGLCCGTGYICQRAALESIGGWITDCSVEDVTTSLELVSNGWITKATDQKVSEGICPETVAEWFQQRLRWTAGNTQLLAYKLPQCYSRLPFRAFMVYLCANMSVVMVSFLAFALAYRMIGSYVYDLFLEPAVSESLCCASGFDAACTRCWVQNISESWLTAESAGLLVYMVLPCLTIRQKLAGMLGMMSQLAVYFSTLRLWIAGRLAPGRKFKHFPSAGEVSGDTSFPRLAYLSIVLSLVLLAPAVAACVYSRHLLLAPESLGSILMSVWFAVMISLPQWAGLGIKTFNAAR
ncbi:hypothetical protein WJX73_009366 [Symbiochloris irregularis]|uniref:Glycosyltransferase 2-like domain-containing protein n=1 Tax=Symbiochloris irregularis TaxID=706552 RepID=A0AAW1PCI3_9CHLO